MSDDPDFYMRDGKSYRRCERCDQFWQHGPGRYEIDQINGRMICKACAPDGPFTRLSSALKPPPSG